MLRRLGDLFPLWAVLFSLGALAAPQIFTPMKPAIVPLLGVVMLGMGMTLTGGSFAEVARQPRKIGIGVVLQFGFMPLIALGVATGLGLERDLLVGLVLVGCCPGGTASNVITYLARGDVALSISLTAVSTVVALVATPTLALVYLGQTVEIDWSNMLLSVLKIVVVPVVLGTVINTYFGQRLTRVRDVFPLVSVAAIVVIIAIIVALNEKRIATLGPQVVLAVALHNGIGLAVGYGCGRLLGFDARTCRTLAIEVGMQNSGLGVALANKYFTAAAALPGAVFSVWHNLTGSALAAAWSRSSDDKLVSPKGT